MKSNLLLLTLMLTFFANTSRALDLSNDATFKVTKGKCLNPEKEISPPENSEYSVKFTAATKKADVNTKDGENTAHHIYNFKIDGENLLLTNGIVVTIQGPDKERVRPAQRRLQFRIRNDELVIDGGAPGCPGAAEGILTRQ